MFSKEWKLVAVSLATLSCLALTTGCGKDKKKKSKPVPLTGLWINATADQELTRFANSGDPRICDVVLSNPAHFGISVGWDGEVSLDAWQINKNGEVYQYTSPARASSLGTGYRERYFVGHINREGEFTHKNANMGVALVPPTSRNNCYQAPFARGNADVQDFKSYLSVYSPMTGVTTSYVPVKDKDQLRRLSHALARCTQLAKVARTCFGLSHVTPTGPDQIAPAPGSYPPPPGPGRFHRPTGPQIIEKE